LTRERSAVARRALFFGAAFFLGVACFVAVRPWVSALRVLSALSSPAAVAKPNVATQDFFGDFGGTWARARLYLPSGRAHRCVVVGHGVHYKNIDEPRLEKFANALARAGAVVSTPELAELADYRITSAGSDVLGGAVIDLAERCRAVSDGKVGLLGFSFAGGLSLLAATDEAVRSHLAYVASVGGYDDLSRVLRFLLSDTVTSPDGSAPRKAHEYGIVVLLYEHLDAFVPEVDRPVMSRAIRAWLMEDRPSAWSFASERVTRDAEDVFMALVAGKTADIRTHLGAILAGDAAELAALSPHGRLAGLGIPIYLLHGSADSVIPPEETMWADTELRGVTHLALVTPLLEHVELSSESSVRDAFRLVDFVARLL
jgi:dienelactone hydrolase